MDSQAAFRARLIANSTINSLTGGRVSWGGRPQSAALPAVVLTKAASGQEWTHDGPDALIRPWVQIDIWSATQPSGAAIAAVVQAEMQRLDVVTAEGWNFLPPGELVGDQWPGPEDLVGGGTAYRIVQEYQFYAQPA